MARIRSLHPGLSTDEAFMAMSAYAKAAWPILWTECDDHGVFEWKPLVLKARILPADAVDFTALLVEWQGLGSVQKFSHDGKDYGLVRNFCRYQRPKKPAHKHPLPNQFRTYVGIAPEPVPHQGGTGGEKSPQMKEEGGSREEVEEERKEEAAQDAADPKSEPSTAKKGTRLPAGWEPSARNEQDALAIGLPLLAQAAEARKFRDYWLGKSGRDATKVDWDATWRLWVTRACEQRVLIKPQSAGEPVAQVVWIGSDSQLWREAAARHEREKGKPPSVLTLRNHESPGNYFPAGWLSAEPERAGGMTTI